jgi:hypothetical protein
VRVCMWVWGSISHATERNNRAEQSRAEHDSDCGRGMMQIAGSRPSSDVSKRRLELETSLAGSVVVARLPVSGQARDPWAWHVDYSISNVPQALP